MRVQTYKVVISGYWLLIALLLTINAAYADSKLKPFMLASKSSGNMEKMVADTQAKLTDAGFEVVGVYSPYAGATVMVVTNDALKANAKATPFGGYGAVQRVAVTDMNGEIQVSYTNPAYMSYAYRMQDHLEGVGSALASALGGAEPYGSENGLTAKKLKKYHYMFGMPYFDDPVVLANHSSYEAAIKAVEAGLAAKKGGVSKVYRVDIPGKKQSVFGVAMTEDMSSDKTIMTEIDFKPVRSTAHLPYEMLVDGDGTVYTLNGKFRIAINFPDLSMAGKNSFMGIMSSPDAIKKALSAVAN